jgi:hypothetical protein
VDVTCGTDGEVETYIYTTQHDHQTHLNVAIFGLVRAVGGVLSIVGGGVAAARLQHKLRPERGADARIANGWAKGMQSVTQFRSFLSTPWLRDRLEMAPAQRGECQHTQHACGVLPNK